MIQRYFEWLLNEEFLRGIYRVEWNKGMVDLRGKDYLVRGSVECGEKHEK